MQTLPTIKRNVTVKEMETILANTEMVHGMSKIAHVTHFTKPRVNVKCRQTGEPFTGLVQKRSSYSVHLNTVYAKVVTNQLERENKDKTDYKAGQNTMPLDKSQSKNNFFGTYDGKGVIELKPNNNATIKPETTWFLNGKEVEKSVFPDVLPTSKKPQNQGTDKEIPWRKVYVMNFERIAIDGVEYTIIK